MQTLTVPVWVWAVLGWLAVSGFTTWCWVVAGWAERAADWWHDRRAPRADEAEECPICHDTYYDLEEHLESGVKGCGAAWLEESPPLPPERTWEQMTAHQLPLEPPTGPLSVNRERIAPLLGSRQATAHFRRLEKARQRRWMVVSAEIWRAYEALGLEGTGFTRAMAARVRELTP